MLWIVMNYNTATKIEVINQWEGTKQLSASSGVAKLRSFSEAGSYSFTERNCGAFSMFWKVGHFGLR